MKHLQGSADHLNGRAVIFLDLKEPQTFMDDQAGMGLIAVFCAAGEVDLLELIIQVIRLPREHSRLINRFYKRYFQEIEEIKRSFPERISKIIIEVLEEMEEKEEVSEPIREAFREMFSPGRKEKSEQSEETAEKPSRLPQPEFYSTMIPLPNPIHRPRMVSISTLSIWNAVNTWGLHTLFSMLTPGSMWRST